MTQLTTTIPPATVGGIPVPVWQKTKTDEAFARYHVRRSTAEWTPRAAAFALEAQLIAITAMCAAAEGEL